LKAWQERPFGQFVPPGAGQGALGRVAAAALDLLARHHNAPNSKIGTFETCRRTQALGLNPE